MNYVVQCYGCTVTLTDGARPVRCPDNCTVTLTDGARPVTLTDGARVTYVPDPGPALGPGPEPGQTND